MKGNVGIIILGAIIFLGLILAFTGMWMLGTYNGLVGKEESVKTQWGAVESVYQRRFDLIPNLVATAKGYATHEKAIWMEFADARAAFSQAKSQQQQIDASNQLESVLTKLAFVTEQYPELKANENFLQLQSQLEGTENRINVERQRYNEVVREYAVTKRTFPTNMIAGMFNFKEYPYFDSKKGAEDAPIVDFGQ